jgi:uncharacterized sporulation protein YeaH/YhbH (DUF444 family)
VLFRSPSDVGKGAKQDAFNAHMSEQELLSMSFEQLVAPDAANSEASRRVPGAEHLSICGVSVGGVKCWGYDMLYRARRQQFVSSLAAVITEGSEGGCAVDA